MTDGPYYYLKRFLADPSLVRVSIRRTDEGWVAKVEPRKTPSAFFASARSLDPKRAIEDALQLANTYRIPGLNLGLDNAHEHPWGAVAYAIQGPDPKERTTRHVER